LELDGSTLSGLYLLDPLLDIIDVFPSYEELAYRLELDGSTLSGLYLLDPLLGRVVEEINQCLIYPRTFFSTPRNILMAAIENIEKELQVSPRSGKTSRS